MTADHVIERLARRLAPLGVAVLVAASACQQRQEVEEEGGADTMTTEDTMMLPPPAPPAEMDTAMGADTETGAAGAGGAAQVSVTNTHPHPMVVKADGQELGAVQPNETRTLDLPPGAADAVQLTASDEGGTHTIEGTVTAGGGEPASWTIQ